MHSSVLKIIMAVDIEESVSSDIEGHSGVLYLKGR